MKLHQLDVKTEFFYGKLEEEIFMKQPEGFEVADKKDYVYRLKKSLYRLKQSPSQWYKRFILFIISCYFFRSSYDSFFILKNLKMVICYICS